MQELCFSCFKNMYMEKIVHSQFRYIKTQPIMFKLTALIQTKCRDSPCLLSICLNKERGLFLVHITSPKRWYLPGCLFSTQMLSLLMNPSAQSQWKDPSSLMQASFSPGHAIARSLHSSTSEGESNGK